MAEDKNKDAKHNAAGKQQSAIVPTADAQIRSLIYMVRGRQVMLDSDLAMLYEVETGNLNRAAKRNEKGSQRTSVSD